MTLSYEESPTGIENRERLYKKDCVYLRYSSYLTMSHQSLNAQVNQRHMKLHAEHSKTPPLIKVTISTYDSTDTGEKLIIEEGLTVNAKAWSMTHSLSGISSYCVI